MNPAADMATGLGWPRIIAAAAELGRLHKPYTRNARLLLVRNMLQSKLVARISPRGDQRLRHSLKFVSWLRETATAASASGRQDRPLERG